MKGILFVAILALTMAACDTPQTTTGTASDSTMIRSDMSTDTTTNRTDSTRQ